MLKLPQARRRSVAVILCIAALAIGIYGIGRKEGMLPALWSAKKDQPAQQQESPPTVVTMQTVKTEDFKWSSELPAQTAGYLEFQVRARVEGILQKRTFREGQFVKKDVLLFEIEPDKYQLKLNQARAQLAQADAELARTLREKNRNETLYTQNAISQKERDDSVSAWEMAAANRMLAKANADEAQLDLSWTKVTAPVSGIVRKESQTVGSLVSPAGQTSLLTTMLQTDLLYVNFSIPEPTYTMLYSIVGHDVRGLFKAELLDDRDVSKGRQYVPLEIEFLDSASDSSTAAISVKAKLRNEKYQFLPGQFVNVRLSGPVWKDAVFIPQSAMVAKDKENYVYIVDDQSVAHLRKVRLIGEFGGRSLIYSGLENGERIVVEGTLKVRPESKVVPAATSGDKPGGGTNGANAPAGK